MMFIDDNRSAHKQQNQIKLKISCNAENENIIVLLTYEQPDTARWLLCFHSIIYKRAINLTWSIDEQRSI